MKNLGCMMTDVTVAVDEPYRSDDVIVVMRKGKIIGVLSAEAQQSVRTLRMTFTRDTPTAEFVPLQGVGVEHFRAVHPDDAA